MSLHEIDSDMWQAYVWKRLAVSLFEQVESLTGATEVGVNLDPSMPWPNVILTTTPTSAKLSRDNTE